MLFLYKFRKETSHQIEVLTHFNKERLLKSLKKLNFYYIEYHGKNQESFYGAGEIKLVNSTISVLMIAMITVSFQPAVIQVRSVNKEICLELEAILKKMLDT